MPTVLRHAGFSVRILLPPREHGPPHVHVFRSGGVVVIELPATDHATRIRAIGGMRDADVIAAFRLVEEHVDYLRERWNAFHE